MGTRTILPMIDLVFLTLGAVVAMMTQMHYVTALPVDVARAASGAAIAQSPAMGILGVSGDGTLTLDGGPLGLAELPLAAAGRSIVVRADRTLPTQTLIEVLAALDEAAADVALEVQVERTPEQR